ncbi:MAG: tetratricopeptide repeat protein [Microcoleaceae cyanobacterium]
MIYSFKSIIAIIFIIPGLLGWNFQINPAIADIETPINQLVQQAFSATDKGDFVTAENIWSQLIEEYPDNPAGWSNRGNVRISQYKLAEAVSDYNQAIELAPTSPDPYLNRGVAYEALQQWDQAIADYNYVLELTPNDAIAYNNRGNAEAGLGHWKSAIADYQKATEIQPAYAFARANYALALYQDGQEKKAIKTLKNIVRKYPNFAETRAALTACLWQAGLLGEAESNWVAAIGLDSRYKDLNWVANVRRWPPKMLEALDQFINLR